MSLKGVSVVIGYIADVDIVRETEIKLRVKT